LQLTSQQPKPGGASDPKQAEEKEMKKKRILTPNQVTPAQRLLAFQGKKQHFFIFFSRSMF